MPIKELLQELLNELKENEERELKLAQLSRLWVVWNARLISSDELASKMDDILKKENDIAWNDFVKHRATEAKGSLSRLIDLI